MLQVANLLYMEKVESFRNVSLTEKTVSGRINESSGPHVALLRERQIASGPQVTQV